MHASLAQVVIQLLHRLSRKWEKLNNPFILPDLKTIFKFLPEFSAFSNLIGLGLDGGRDNNDDTEADDVVTLIEAVMFGFTSSSEVDSLGVNKD